MQVMQQYLNNNVMVAFVVVNEKKTKPLMICSRHHATLGDIWCAPSPKALKPDNIHFKATYTSKDVY